MKRLILPLLLILAACAPTESNTDQTSLEPAPVSNITSIPTDDPALLPTLFPNMAGNGEMTRIDEQGAVVIEVTPLNLATLSDQLEFDVSMNTHSVDLSMDLATLATLTADTGVMIQATLWEAPLGGHHVEGKLIFPATKDGKSILEDASKLTLTIANLDAASRIFEWELK
jgi:hypothetical protein